MIVMHCKAELTTKHLGSSEANGQSFMQLHVIIIHSSKHGSAAAAAAAHIHIIT
jgi:hypothetical protein